MQLVDNGCGGVNQGDTRDTVRLPDLSDAGNAGGPLEPDRDPDIMFGNRRHYGDLVRLSEEGIASNILANRLVRLVQSGLLSRANDPTHKQKTFYSLTEASIQLVPLLAYMGAWGCRHTSASRELSIRAQLLEKGGERMWKAFMAELRSIHLGAPAPRRSVSTELQAAFESAVSREAKTRRSSKTR